MHSRATQPYITYKCLPSLFYNPSTQKRWAQCLSFFLFWNNQTHILAFTQQERYFLYLMEENTMISACSRQNRMELWYSKKQPPSFSGLTHEVYFLNTQSLLWVRWPSTATVFHEITQQFMQFLWVLMTWLGNWVDSFHFLSLFFAFYRKYSIIYHAWWGETLRGLNHSDDVLSSGKW